MCRFAHVGGKRGEIVYGPPNTRAFVETLQNHKKIEATTQDQQKANCKSFLAEKRFGVVLPRRKATTEIWDLPCFRCSASIPERFSSRHDPSHTIFKTNASLTFRLDWKVYFWTAGTNLPDCRLSGDFERSQVDETSNGTI